METKKAIGWEMGRNGCYDIYDLELTDMRNGERIKIDGVGKSGKILNGGISVDKEILIQKLRGLIPVPKNSLLLAMEWGYKAHEKSMNLQMAQSEFRKILYDQEANTENTKNITRRI